MNSGTIGQNCWWHIDGGSYVPYIAASSETQDYVSVYQKTWDCEPSDSPNRRIEHVSLPPYYGYRPGHFNKYSVSINSCFLMAWVLDPEKYAKERQRKGKSFYHLAVKKVKHRLTIVPPYQLPDKPMDRCLSWWLAVKSRAPYTPQCNIEPGKFNTPLRLPLP